MSNDDRIDSQYFTATVDEKDRPTTTLEASLAVSLKTGVATSAFSLQDYMVCNLTQPCCIFRLGQG